MRYTLPLSLAAGFLATAAQAQDVKVPETRLLRGHSERVTCLAFSPDGKTLATGGPDRSVHLWNVATGTRQAAHQIAARNEITAIAYGAPEQVAYAVAFDRWVQLYDTKRRTTQQLSLSFSSSVTSLAFAPDGTKLYAPGVTVLDLTVAKNSKPTKLSSPNGQVHILAVSKDGDVAATAETSKVRVNVWKGDKRLELFADVELEVVTARALAFRSDGKILAGGIGASIYLWDFSGELPVAAIPNEFNGVRALAFRPGSNLLAAASFPGINLFDIGTQKKVATIKSNGISINAIAISPDGKTLAGACDDRLVRLWDIAGIQVELGAIAGKSGRNREPENAKVVRGHVSEIGLASDAMVITGETGRGEKFGIHPKKLDVKLLIDGKPAALKDFRLRDKVEVLSSERDKRVVEVRLLEHNEKLSLRAEAFEKIRPHLTGTQTIFNPNEPAEQRHARIARIAETAFKLVADEPKDEVAADILIMILKQVRDPLGDSKAIDEIRLKAGALLLEHQPNHGSFALYITSLRYGERAPAGLLEKLLEAKNAGVDLRAEACDLLAQRAFNASYPNGDKEQTALAQKYYQRLQQEFPDVKLATLTMAQRADRALYTLDKLWVGKKALEIEGVTLDGKQTKLSDFRGKVVLLTFWSAAGAPSLKLKLEQRLLTLHKGKPFAVVSVGLAPDRAQVEWRVQRDRVSWPVWYDDGKGPIAQPWQAQQAYGAYVIDAEGIIRAKGATGPARPEQVIEQLLKSLDNK